MKNLMTCRGDCQKEGKQKPRTHQGKEAKLGNASVDRAPANVVETE
jgi:hypothetical protein